MSATQISNHNPTTEQDIPMNTKLPQLDGRVFLSEGGLETDLIFHHDIDLPDFASFPLLESPSGRDR